MVITTCPNGFTLPVKRPFPNMPLRVSFSLFSVLAILVNLVAADPSRPNIVWIYADDHAYQAISAYSDRFKELAPTPNIDRLAKEGAIFRNSYVANSICGPARACILTGLHSHKNNVPRNGMPMDFSNPTFPGILRDSGYVTAVYGKWHLKVAPEGFDDWKIMLGQGRYFNQDYRMKTDSGEKSKRIEGYSSDTVADMTMDFLRTNAGKGKPVMVMCQFKSPHGPWSPALRNLDFLKDQTIAEPPTFYDDHSGRTAAGTANMTILNTMRESFHLKGNPDSAHYDRLPPEQRKRAIESLAYENRRLASGQLKGDDLQREKYQRYIHDYLRCVKANDENVGRILDYLEESGLAENTIVCYSSDQSFYLGEHGWYDKRFMYHQSFFTPLLMRWPGKIQAGTEVEELVQNIDMAPTFLSIGGARIPETMQGEALVPLFEGDSSKDWRKSLYYHFYESEDNQHKVAKHEGVYDGRFKLINFYELGEWEFFDREIDPYELHNRIEDPHYQDTIAKLRIELKRLKKQYDVEMPQ